MKTLVLNTEIYSLSNVEKARRAYKDYATVLIRNRDNKLRAYFLHCRYDENQTIKEFENYLIGLENL